MRKHILNKWPVYAEDEVQAVADVLRAGKGNYWAGDAGRKFEAEYAENCGAKYAIALANGTVALELALAAAGIGPGDEVIVTPRSFVASASCAIRVGARPVFADVSAESQNITPETVKNALTPSTKAIIAVHHAGWPCDMDGLMLLGREHNLVVIEDCAQAHGAKYDGRPVGGLGHIGAFSFCHDKIITTGGEGGMLVTNDTKIWEKAWSIKDHGKSYEAVFNRDYPPGFRWLHESIGTNWRMTEMQAAIGRIQLQKLPGWQRQRTENAHRIANTLRKYPSIRIQDVSANIEHAYYRLYGFLQNDGLRDDWNRRRILDAIGEHGIPVYTGSCPEIYREKAFQDLGLAPPAPLPVAAELGETSLAFLVHPTMTDSDIEQACDAINTVFDSASK